MPTTFLIFCAVLGNNFGLSKSTATKACEWVPTAVTEAEKNNIVKLSVKVLLGQGLLVLLVHVD